MASKFYPLVSSRFVLPSKNHSYIAHLFRVLESPLAHIRVYQSQKSKFDQIARGHGGTIHQSLLAT